METRNSYNRTSSNNTSVIDLKVDRTKRIISYAEIQVDKDAIQKRSLDFVRKQIVKMPSINLLATKFDEKNQNKIVWGCLSMFIHAYPDEPTDEEQRIMTMFIEKFVNLIPEGRLGDLFRYCYAYYNKPDTKSRGLLSEWLCFTHNQVKVKLMQLERETTQTYDQPLKLTLYPERRRFVSMFDTHQENFSDLDRVSSPQTEENDFKPNHGVCKGSMVEWMTKDGCFLNNVYQEVNLHFLPMMWMASVNLNDFDFEKKQMGRLGWSCLSVFINGYPMNPTLEQKLDMSDFIYCFANLYPCLECRDHFLEMYNAHPLPPVESKSQLWWWFNFTHNVVNKRTGSSIYPLVKVNNLERNDFFHV